MKKLSLVVVIGMVASLTVVLGVMGPAGSQQPQERQTITLFDPQKTNFEKFLNEGRRGISSGDSVLFVEKQLDAETCEPAGRLTGNIVVVKRVGKRNAEFIGQFTVKLADGKITAAGAARFSEFESTEPIFAVTGGTGIYRDASGEVSIDEDTELCGQSGDLTSIDIGPRP